VTTICGYRDTETGDVWIAADSRSSDRNFIFPDRARKILCGQRWVIGYSGSGRAGILIERLKPKLDEAVHPQDAADIVVQQAVLEGWPPYEEKGGPRCFDLSLVLSDGKGLWAAYSSGTVIEPADGFIAIGSGDDYALGAWHALRYGAFPGWPHEMPGPRGVLSIVMEAAMAFDAATGGEIAIVNASKQLRTPA
jgi:ATP-dependent protease HslVU (ClpYQ) peptidase subunit